VHGFFFNGNAKVGIAINLRGGDIGVFGSLGGNIGIYPEIPGFHTGFQASQHNNYGGNKDVIEGLGGQDVGYAGSLFLGGEKSWSKNSITGERAQSGVETTSVNLGFGWEAAKNQSKGASFNLSRWLKEKP
jgi:hypothetical protein